MLVARNSVIDAQLNDGAGPLFVASQNGHECVKGRGIGGGHLLVWSWDVD
jgi:hypothetical protein